jgi:hypothetical protein
VELPRLIHQEYLAESFLLFVHGVLDSVRHVGCHFLRELGFASVKCPLSDSETTSVYVTRHK